MTIYWILFSLMRGCGINTNLLLSTFSRAKLQFFCEILIITVIFDKVTV